MAIKTPFLAVDGIVQIFDNNDRFRGIVLVERKNEPVGLAIPGGFVEIGETVEQAVIREIKEEINLDVKINRILGVYSDPKRDPRFHVVSVVFICSARGEPVSGSDAKEAYICKVEDIPFDRLVFDHAKILRDYINR